MNNLRTRVTVRFCNWLLRTVAPEYAEVLALAVKLGMEQLDELAQAVRGMEH